MQTDLTHNRTITFLQCLGRNDRLSEDQAEKGAKDNEQSIITKVNSHEILCTARNTNCPIWHSFWLTSKPVTISYQIDGLIHLSMSDLQFVTSTLMTGTQQVSETLAVSPPTMWLTGTGQFSKFVHCESLKFHLSQANFFSMFKLIGHTLPSTLCVVNIKSVSLQICILPIEEFKN